MKRADHVGLGFALIVLTGSLWAQVPDARAPGAATSLAESTKTPHDASFVIGNDDLLAINVWKEPELTRSIPVRLKNGFRCRWWERFRLRAAHLCNLSSISLPSCGATLTNRKSRS